MENMNEWELLKENVEPIKSGRSIKTLKSALNEKPNELNARELKRKEFESDLRTYSGSDLLSVYYDYVVWVEQNYPLGGNEANLKTLLENCIEQFYTTDQYQNDERLLQVFLKFIKRVDSPLELFTFFHENGFATKLANFYINWSFHLENHRNVRKAGEVLRKGIQLKAEPFGSLKRSLDELEVRVAKAIASDKMEDLNDNEEYDDQRKPLNGLKTKTKKGKTVAPVKRIGSALRSKADILKNSVPIQSQTRGPAIYCDENDPTVEPKVGPSLVSHNVKGVVTVGQENQLKAGKWSENVVPQKRVATDSQPKFVIHADDSDDESPVKRPPPQSNKMRARGVDSPPIARFEKPDPLKKFAFNMNKVYAGGEEFSFEEIRGRKWMAKKKREEEALRNRKLEDEVAQLRTLVQQLLTAQTSQQSSQHIKQNVVQNHMSHQNNENHSLPPSSAESSGHHSANQTNSTNSSSNATKNAFSLVRDLWNGTLANHTADIHQNKSEEDNKEAFAIYSDTTILSKAEDKISKPRESIGSMNYTIALPRTEMTFIANTNCSSTPVNDKKSEEDYNFKAIPSLQNQYNFIGGMTAKLTPIVETSREYNSKSSSSSSGAMTTTGSHALSRRNRGSTLSINQRKNSFNK